jgi:protein TonB
MYQSLMTNQRMKIGVSLRQALIWSLAAHVSFLILTRIDTEFDGGVANRVIVTTISPKPAVSAARTPPSASPAQVVAAKSDHVAVPAVRPTRTDAEPPMREAPDVTVDAPSAALLPPRAAAADAEGLRSYRLTLAREARRLWRYPQQALDQQWEGTTDIRIELLPGGRLLSTSVEKSSGHASLDDAARLMMSNAAASAQLPASLAGDSLSILVPVKFSLATEKASKAN